MVSNKSWCFNDFGFKKALGEGQYGKVFLARELNSNKLVALKIMFLKKYAENNILDQLKQEIEIHSHLIHNRIARVYGSFVNLDRVGIVMEYAPEGTLFNLMIKNNWMKGMPMKYVQQVARQVYSALAYCHTHNVMHRDLKPENILIFKNIDTRTGKGDLEVKLTDFGWSCIKQDKPRFTLCGTVSYMAPEQSTDNGKGYDGSAETWAFGVLLYELVVGLSEEEEQEKVDLLALSKDLTKNDPRALRNMRFRRNANPEIFDLCRKILVEEADKRIKFESIKYHPFFNQDYSNQTRAPK
ncbi:hypothetical protein AV274_3992 [Blastocystis sp. ATCC 50177/Nand II]|uniref:Protein kinase domain-containing protein n=1 Tax=Blastocystis sp. subtype 1 (strain ATCC 50177 / NandII) TaxID=478820 RepID=A0A196SB91_BLAHN|nr:hypothetical protein AV274_3992 [Blastocystis sp. ATCC 50177/Nand II]